MGRIILILLSFVLSYASDARFAGMGNLSLLFQDDLYKLDLYDFAGIPAGLIKNDSSPGVAVRASGLKEIWQKDSLTYFALGQALPQKLTDYAPVEAVAFYEVIPQLPLVPCELIYTSSRLRETYDDWGKVIPPQAWRIYTGYGQLNRGYIGDTINERVRTPAISGVYSRALSKNFDYGFSGDVFYGTYNSADNEDKVTLFPPGCGGGIVYNSNKINIGLNGEYHYPMFELKETWGSATHATKFSGHSASPTLGSLVKLDKITWITALNYKWVSLGGKYDNSDIGDLKITGYTAKTMALFVPNFARFALFGELNDRTPVYIDNDGDKWFESAYRNYLIGIGTGTTVKNLTVGIEGLYKYNFMNDKLEDTSVTGNDYVIKLGAEFTFIKNLFIRGGYNYNQIDPNLDEADDNTIFNVITGGLGINLIENTRIDIGYNYKWGKAGLDPEEKITDHIVFLYFRYIIKRGLD